MMSSGRNTFSPPEKACLQDLISKYKLNTAAMSGHGNPYARKKSWARLTEEYNSIEANSKRTEAQLRKCWDNIKTRKRGEALKLRERMKNKCGISAASTSEGSPDVALEVLLESSDIKLQHFMDTDSHDIKMTDGPSDTVPVAQETTHRPSTGLDYEAVSQAQVQENVRSHIINEEFMLRRVKYEDIRHREDELHKLRLAEREWQVKTAEQQYHKSRLEKELAEFNLELAKKNS